MNFIKSNTFCNWFVPWGSAFFLKKNSLCHDEFYHHLHTNILYLCFYEGLIQLAYSYIHYEEKITELF
jgi:hypothetical protein